MPRGHKGGARDVSGSAKHKGNMQERIAAMQSLRLPRQRVCDWLRLRRGNYANTPRMEKQMSTHEQRIAQLEAELAKRDAQIAQMKEDSARKLTLKVGESGTVCLYHGARYPVAIYAEQWERIIPFIKSGAVERFIEANRSALSFKNKA